MNQQKNQSFQSKLNCFLNINEENQLNDQLSQTNPSPIVYGSTCLVEGKPTLRVDISFNEYSEKDFDTIIQLKQHSYCGTETETVLIDPEQKLKEAYSPFGMIETLVDYDQIEELCQQAKEHYLRSIPRTTQTQFIPQQYHQELNQLGIHKVPLYIPWNQQQQKLSKSDKLALRNETIVRRRLAKLLKVKIYELNDTLRDLKWQLGRPSTSMKLLRKQFKLSEYGMKQVRSYLRDGEVAFKFKYQRLMKWKKIHQLAEAGLLQFIKDKRFPKSITQIKCFLQSEFKLKVTSSMLRQYLKEKFNYQVKQVKYLAYRVDFTSSLLQRQYAASKYIEFLVSGKTIINIDESCLSATSFQTRGVQVSQRRLYCIGARRLNGVSIIAGITNFNQVYFTLNQGHNNSKTLKLFLIKLMDKLTQNNPDWRSNTILLLDNAKYHKSRDMKDFLKFYHIPCIFLGPYHFEMAPIERLFSFIKSKNLNPKDLNTNTKENFQVYMRELASYISSFDYTWISKTFIHCLIPSLKALSMTPMT